MAMQGAPLDGDGDVDDDPGHRIQLRSPHSICRRLSHTLNGSEN